MSKLLMIIVSEPLVKVGQIKSIKVIKIKSNAQKPTIEQIIEFEVLKKFERKYGLQQCEKFHLHLYLCCIFYAHKRPK